VGTISGWFARTSHLLGVMRGRPFHAAGAASVALLLVACSLGGVLSSPREADATPAEGVLGGTPPASDSSVSGSPAPSAALCLAVDVVAEAVIPAWTALTNHTLTFDEAADRVEDAAATLRDLAAAEPLLEAKRDIERLARTAERDVRAMRRQNVSGSGDYETTELVIKWQNRGFRWCSP
jgi:hypothetical protein